MSDINQTNIQNWIKKTTSGGRVIEVIYVETDETGAYVIKETLNQNGTTKEKKRDVIFDFPIELLEIKVIQEFDSPHYKHKEVVYRINIDGIEYTDSVKEIRQLIWKRVEKQPFYSKYNIKFRDYIRIALRSKEKELEIKEKQ